MRKFSWVICIFMFQFFSVEAALARSGGIAGYNENMHFVSDIKMDQTNSLCHLVRKYHFMFLGVYLKSKGYVIAQNNCDTDQFKTLPFGYLEKLQDEGLIPRSVPLKPTFSHEQYLYGFIFWPILAIFLMFGAIKNGRRKKRLNKRLDLMANTPPTAAKIVDAMCHAAASDGMVKDTEIETISAISQKLTGKVFQHDTIRAIIARAEENATLADFTRLAEGLNTANKTMMMRAVLYVIAADGFLEGKEQVFVGGLAKAMGMSNQDVHGLLSELSA